MPISAARGPVNQSTNANFRREMACHVLLRLYAILLKVDGNIREGV
jgi:hypothetical protein